MNLQDFFDHWSITENPFRGEEARHDAVFARMSLGRQGTTAHSDFEKIVGDLARPSTSIVFGEKGSGKTAIRLQIGQLVEQHNADHPDRKLFMLAYDDMNGVLDRLHRRLGNKDPGESLAAIRLVDHIDALLTLAVGRIEGLLGGGSESDPMLMQTARRLPRSTKRDLLLLHAVYAAGEDSPERTSGLRRHLRWPVRRTWAAWVAGAAVGWIPGAALTLWALNEAGKQTPAWDGWEALRWTGPVLLGLWLVLVLSLVAKRCLWDRFTLGAIGRRLRRQIRVGDRSATSYAQALARIGSAAGDAVLPVTGSDEPRNLMFARLRRVLDAFGYSGTMVLIDRVDEPTLVGGDVDRMRAVIWPLLNNKFLQQEGLGVKMLLPIELRHALFKESSAFFQEARLDKQSLVERLGWTGAMLYDLCDSRLRACRPADAEPMSLLDLFAEDVTRRDLVDALDQMHQPRDAFKFIYRCLSEHCSNVTRDQSEWRVPRLVLEAVKKQESDRVQQLYRGIRPA